MLTIAPAIDDVEGLHTVQVEVILQNFPDVKEIATLTITIDPC